MNIIKWYNKTFYLSHAFRWFISAVFIGGVIGGLIYGIAL